MIILHFNLQPNQKPIKEKLISFSYENVKKTALCGAAENGSFRSHHKNKILSFRSRFSCWWEIGNENDIHIVDFYHLTDMLLFQNRITGSLISFDFKSVLARQTPEKVAYKPWNLSVARIMSVLPEKVHWFRKLGGAAAPLAHQLVRLC